MQLKTAQRIAVDICYKLQPHCEKINIAGSIRRQKQELGDIEIVCLPQMSVANNLFGEESSRYRVFDFVDTVYSLGEIIKGNATSGRFIQIQLPQEIKLDLFIPKVEDYYRIYAIRTGSAEYANKVIAAAWLNKGWCGTTNQGLRRQSDCVKRGDDWMCVAKNPVLPKAWTSEEDFFDWIGVKCVHPKLREVENFSFNKHLAR